MTDLATCSPYSRLFTCLLDVAMGTIDPSMVNTSIPQGPVFSPILFYLHDTCVLKTYVDNTASIGSVPSDDET